MPHKLDSIDLKIIQLLTADGRMSNVEIARRIEGASERLVRYRIEKMRQEGYIQISAIVNPVAIGYVVIADVWVEVDPGQALKVAKHLAELDRARYVSYSAGGMKDVTVQIVAHNLEEMYEYVAEVVGAIPGVKSTQTMLIPAVLKDIGDWVPPEAGLTRQITQR